MYLELIYDKDNYVIKIKYENKEYELLRPLPQWIVLSRMTNKNVIELKQGYLLFSGGIGGGVIYQEKIIYKDVIKEKVVYKNADIKYIYRDKEKRNSPVLNLTTLIDMDIVDLVRKFYTISEAEKKEIYDSIDKNMLQITFYFGDRRITDYVSLKVREFWTPWIPQQNLTGQIEYDSPNPIRFKPETYWPPYRFKTWLDKTSKHIIITDEHSDVANTYGALKRLEIRWKQELDRYIDYNNERYFRRS